MSTGLLVTSSYRVQIILLTTVIIIIIIIISFTELGHLLTCSSLMYSEVPLCPASFYETCQWLKFPLNGLRAQSRVSPVVGLLPLTSGLACLGMAFPPFLVKQLYRCDSVVISSFVRTGYTTRRWGWLLGRIGYSITHHYPLYPFYHFKTTKSALLTALLEKETNQQFHCVNSS